MDIKVITLIGANGTMGHNVAAIFATFGNAKVYMIARDIEKASKAKGMAAKSIKSHKLMKNLIPKDFTSLKECVEESDLIYESVAENYETKFEINKKVAEYMKEDQIYCTGSSGLLLSKLADAFPPNFKKNYLGLHMSNPPYNMPMGEMISTEYTDKIIFENMKVYAKTILNRNVAVAKDTAGFLANRISFQFLNQMLQYADKYKNRGGIDYIDSIMGAFTGRVMPPIATVDFAGIDVHKAIVDNLYRNTNDGWKNTFVLPEYVEKLISIGSFGKKVGIGFYKIEIDEDGKKTKYVYDIKSENYREIKQYNHHFAEEMVKNIEIGNYEEAVELLIREDSDEAKLCLECILKYIIYSIYITKTVGETIHSADDVIASGFNWCPPLAMAEALGGFEKVKTLIYERIAVEEYKCFKINELFSNIEKSDYDYRKYIKAKF